jgi:fucose permease
VPDATVPDTRVPRAARVAVSACFGVMGVTGGAWVSRLPAVKEQAHLSDGGLGTALFAAAAGLVAGSLVAGPLVDRLGSRRVVMAGGTGYCLLLIAAGLMHSLAALAPLLAAAWFLTAWLDVGSSSQGVLVETAYGRPVFVSLHACYSLGAMAGSLAGGAFAWAGAGVLATLAAAGLTGAVAVVVAGRWLLPGGGRAAARADPAAAAADPGTAAGAGPAAAAADPGAAAHDIGAAVASESSGMPDADPGAAGGLRHRSVRRLILSLGVLGVCALVGEGAAGDWSAVFLRDNLGTSAGFAAVGFAAFSVTTTAGRLAGDRLAARFGAVRLTRSGGLVAAAGLAFALAGGSALGGTAAVAGFAVFGAGLSSITPQVFSAGGRADPGRPGRGLSLVVGSGYAGMAAGPVLIGAVAGVAGLPRALGIPVLLALWITVSAGVLGMPGLTVGTRHPAR